MRVRSRPTSRALAFAILGMLTALGCAQAEPNDLPDATVDGSGWGSDDGGDGGDDSAPTPTDGATDLGGPGCHASADCRAAAGGPVCDPASGRCVPCTPSEDVCPPGQFCDQVAFSCGAGCNTDSDCTGPITHCDHGRHACVGCSADGDCAPGTVCQSGACTPGCSDTHPCGVGNACCTGVCVNLQTSTPNCGACGHGCAGPGAPGACCMGACVASDRDPANCGGCGVACTPAHGTGACASGACTVAACAAGYGDCDHDPANGCEASLGDDPSNCGACGTACATGTHATGRCVAGACSVTCAAGWGHCAGDGAGACDTALPTSPAHCGTCDHACPVGPNSVATCTMGACGLTCASGYGDCNGDPTDGCEVNLGTSPSSCGACGAACRVPHAVASCTAGRCGLGACLPGFADCNGDTTDGCETATGGDNANCGACARVCLAGTACSGGACTTVCTGSTVFCAGRCVATGTDPLDCGTCGHACSTGAAATATCNSGACGLACAPGYGDCDGSAGNGCETSLRDNVANCGTCGGACARAHATPACVDGACRVGHCLPGYANCSGVDATGCETNLGADTRNCGACGAVCNLPNAGAYCAAGSCAISLCSPGTADCDGVATDGCEVYLASDNFNCGGCGRMCPPGTACAGGSCGSVCTGGSTYCAGSCVDLSSNVRNCGACGRVCGATEVCRASVCVSPGPPNDTCGAAQAVSLATSSVTFSVSTVGASHDMAAPCGGGGGADVFFSFTIPGPAPEMVYADTIGTGFDTVLFFANSCSGAITSPTTAGDQACNDDVLGCLSGGLQSQAFALLGPGTHYLVLSGFGSASGPATVHLQHLPVGNGPLVQLGAGSTSPAGVTSGTGQVTGSCGGSGPENSYWWTSCPESTGGSFTASTCSTTLYDTLIYVRSGTGAGDACNDDSCGLQSSISTSLGGGPGLHVLYIDGWSSSSSGPYTVAVSRP